MFLFLVYASFLGLIGYWLKMRNSMWQKTWGVFSGLLMAVAMLVAIYQLAVQQSKPIIYTFSDGYRIRRKRK